MSPTREQRDVTRALAIAQTLLNREGDDPEPEIVELVRILTAIDARTGKRDPTKRSKRAAKKAGRR